MIRECSHCLHREKGLVNSPCLECHSNKETAFAKWVPENREIGALEVLERIFFHTIERKTFHDHDLLNLKTLSETLKNYSLYLKNMED